MVTVAGPASLHVEVYCYHCALFQCVSKRTFVFCYKFTAINFQLLGALQLYVTHD